MFPHEVTVLFVAGSSSSDLQHLMMLVNCLSARWAALQTLQTLSFKVIKVDVSPSACEYPIRFSINGFVRYGQSFPCFVRLHEFSLCTIGHVVTVIQRDVAGSGFGYLSKH